MVALFSQVCNIQSTPSRFILLLSSAAPPELSPVSVLKHFVIEPPAVFLRMTEELQMELDCNLTPNLQKTN
jgi:hypothetical protein